MQLLNIVLPLLLAGLVSAQAQCFDDLDCLFSVGDMHPLNQ